MWRTPDGELILTGARWTLFREGLCDLAWAIEDFEMDGDSGWPLGIPAFDDLQPGQKLYLLALVGSAVGHEAAPAPSLTVHTEAALAAVFDHVHGLIEMEIDRSGRKDPEDVHYWRRLARAAYAETVGADEVEAAVAARDAGEPADMALVWCPPDPESEDRDAWRWLVFEELADEFFWYRDYELGHDFPGGPHDFNRHLLDRAVVPDPAGKALERIRETIKKLGRHAGAAPCT